MDIGYRIKKIRKLRGLTQKELGMAIGFDEKTADIRIAQYESGARVPREGVVNKLADVLKVSPKALTIPTINSIDDIMQMLFAIEDACRDESLFEESALKINFVVWQEIRQQVFNGNISKEEYDMWRYNYLPSLKE